MPDADDSGVLKVLYSTIYNNFFKKTIQRPTLRPLIPLAEMIGVVISLFSFSEQLLCQICTWLYEYC